VGATLSERQGRLTGFTQALNDCRKHRRHAIVLTNDRAGVKRIVDDVGLLPAYIRRQLKTDGTFRQIKVAMWPPGLTVAPPRPSRGRRQ
jgi:hypothetical protein